MKQTESPRHAASMGTHVHAWQTPELVRFGQVAELTASGSGTEQESGTCDPNSAADSFLCRKQQPRA